jgi:hypothetical protein
MDAIGASEGATEAPLIPDRIEHIASDGSVLVVNGTRLSFPYPLEHSTSYHTSLELCQMGLRGYWRKEGGKLLPARKVKPLPHAVRVVAADGQEICRWSKEDELGVVPYTLRLYLRHKIDGAPPFKHVTLSATNDAEAIKTGREQISDSIPDNDHTLDGVRVCRGEQTIWSEGKCPP